MSPIVGTVDGADAAGEDGNGLRGAVGGRMPPVTPFHGHIVSFAL